MMHPDEKVIYPDYVLEFSYIFFFCSGLMREFNPRLDYFIPNKRSLHVETTKVLYQQSRFRSYWRRERMLTQLHRNSPPLFADNVSICSSSPTRTTAK